MNAIRLGSGGRVEVGGNAQFTLPGQDVRLMSHEVRWAEFDVLPIHLKRFLWSASVELALDPRKPNDLASLEARERDRVRATALKVFGPAHPQAESDFRPLERR